MNKPIAFVGQMGSGKSALSLQLKNIFLCPQLSLANPLKADIKRFNLTPDGEIIKSRDRKLLQDYGQLRRGELEQLNFHCGEICNENGIALGTYRAKSGYAIAIPIGLCYSNHWIDLLLMEIYSKPNRIFVVDDVRRQNEADALKRQGFVLVKVNVDEEVRRGRLGSRDGSFDETSLNDISETEIENIECDFSISNNGTLNDALHKLLGVI